LGINLAIVFAPVEARAKFLGLLPRLARNPNAFLSRFVVQHKRRSGIRRDNPESARVCWNLYPCHKELARPSMAGAGKLGNDQGRHNQNAEANAGIQEEPGMFPEKSGDKLLGPGFRG
jgi:hypothetical protein